MAEEFDPGRGLRELAVEHAEAHWLVHRLGDEATEIRRTLRAHTARFDSTDAVLRSLHQMVGQVLERLPEEPDHAER